MKKFNLIAFTGIIFAMGMATTFGQAFAAVIYQSASPGPADCTAGGSTLDNTQFLGARFNLGSTTTLTGVGGRVCGSSAADDFFAAILPLTGPGALPGFDPLDLVSNALASATFVPGDGGNDVTIPFSLTLGPGNYALVFGAGLLGTSGFGWMPETNTDLPGASYFFAGVDSGGGTSSWNEGDFTNTRFFVMADASTNPIPEPATALLVLLGIGMTTWSRRGRPPV
ncbi:PEP-CTERM sorting domain-containing protein [Candidatus Nitrotoga sp. AM1P]|uniref:PEP-CTERM sorting domain-containing protein n=1 Tax=Candidatus Nitrotoga sp. AM1P TaxID=2559597 RepID=UPI0010AFAB39|nr:PEP-CTERM sorting domain-containing protein [Candidatus Nitrotoga sp. AM1P]BBJ23508.1 hypothetical protein W01_14350 [Candidatus Nitrotoga sp. AM1P]